MSEQLSMSLVLQKQEDGSDTMVEVFAIGNRTVPRGEYEAEKQRRFEEDRAASIRNDAEMAEAMAAAGEKAAEKAAVVREERSAAVDELQEKLGLSDAAAELLRGQP